MCWKQEQVKLASASIDSIVNDGGSSSATEPVAADVVDAAASLVESKAVLAQPSDVPAANKDVEVKAKEGPTRCNACKKRVGLTGFNCRCGNIFCAVHRYSDKHSCPFDYRMAARDAIARANPVIKAEKLEKI
ncbi:hypothetical protein J5N97_005387 [Dioscorea zingiberensis]|uniref:AN1-type domain-containing protein n=1 Tax=Dioscorea zingiberensis TaxID=325984 RepID=A0A9D5HSN4_9LILI|nr:hypothetical protein J5N97_005387 [Dioscorea zingiberensis]